MLQGFDIPLNRQEIFSNAREKNRRLLDDFGIPLISLATNARKYTENWVEGHGLIIGALLTMLSDHFGRGIVAATNPYAMSLPVGSHFVTDRLMGSDRFSIEHLGAGATRLDKIRTLTGWALIDENLRICWSGKQLDRNCRQCRKCVLAAMMFDLLVVRAPAVHAAWSAPALRMIRTTNRRSNPCFTLNLAGERQCAAAAIPE